MSKLNIICILKTKTKSGFSDFGILKTKRTNGYLNILGKISEYYM